MVSVYIQQLNEHARIPSVAHEGDACVDISSVEQVTIPPHEIRVVGCGFAIALPEGFEAQIRPRSGLAAKNGITVLNSPGTIDSGYRGEIKVILYNVLDTPFTIEIGDRIAQMAIRPVPRLNFRQVEVLPVSIRGSNGFGSTGIKG